MTMSPGLRKLGLTAHITFSIGWLGAVGSFLVLSIAGLTSQDAEIVRGTYLAMNLIGQFIIVPLSLAALLTGLIQSLGTHWGLFRHYWVLVKFTLTIGAVFLLLLHQFTAVAEAARRVSGAAPGTVPDVRQLGVQLVGDAGLAILVLLVITTLGMFKPWGLTGYGRRKQQQERRKTLGEAATSASRSVRDADTEMIGKGLPAGLKIFLAIVAVIVAVFLVVHIAGGGLGRH